MALSSVDLAFSRNKGEDRQLSKKLTDIERQESLKSRRLMKEHQDLKHQLMRMKSCSSINTGHVRLPKLPHVHSNGQLSGNSQGRSSPFQSPFQSPFPSPFQSPRHSPTESPHESPCTSPSLRRKNRAGSTTSDTKRISAPIPEPKSPLLRRRVMLCNDLRTNSESDLFNMKKKKDAQLNIMKEYAKRTHPNSFTNDTKRISSDQDEAFEQLLLNFDRLGDDDRDDCATSSNTNQSTNKDSIKEVETKSSKSALYRTNHVSFDEGMGNLRERDPLRKLGPLAKTYANSPVLQRKSQADNQL